jgi:hypothetical protein
MAITLKISAHRLNMANHSPHSYHRASSRAFSSRAEPASLPPRE